MKRVFFSAGRARPSMERQRIEEEISAIYPSTDEWDYEKYLRFVASPIGKKLDDLSGQLARTIYAESLYL